MRCVEIRMKLQGKVKAVEHIDGVRFITYKRPPLTLSVLQKMVRERLK